MHAGDRKLTAENGFMNKTVLLEPPDVREWSERVKGDRRKLLLTKTHLQASPGRLGGDGPLAVGHWGLTLAALAGGRLAHAAAAGVGDEMNLAV